MAGNTGGPWGGGGSRGNGSGGHNGGDDRRPPRRPGEGTQIPELADPVTKGREQLRVLMGGGGGNRRPSGPGGQGGGDFRLTRGTIALIVLVLIGLWGYMSVYTVRPEERSVEMLLGRFSSMGEPGLNFAPWPVYSYEVVNVTSERTENIGSTGGGSGDTSGLMLTTDANLVDIGFQVVWNVSDPAKLTFNIRDAELTVRSAAESVMREIIASTLLAPILNVDRGVIADRARTGIQETMDAYDSGINIVRVNLQRADPPGDVIDSFRAVQAAEQERDRLQRQADAYSNRVLAEARGQAARVLEAAEAYRAQTINDALGQASRFGAVLVEYVQAPEVTRRRLYLETMERVIGRVDTIILDQLVAGGGGGQGVIPFLPLDQLLRGNAGGAAAPAPGAAMTSTAGNN